MPYRVYEDVADRGDASRKRTNYRAVLHGICPIRVMKSATCTENSASNPRYIVPDCAAVMQGAHLFCEGFRGCPDQWRVLEPKRVVPTASLRWY